MQGWAGLVAYFERKQQGVSLVEVLALRLLICNYYDLGPTLHWQAAEAGVPATTVVVDLLSLALEKHCQGAELETFSSAPAAELVALLFALQPLEKGRLLQRSFELSYYSDVAQVLQLNPHLSLRSLELVPILHLKQRRLAPFFASMIAKNRCVAISKRPPPAAAPTDMRDFLISICSIKALVANVPMDAVLRR
jgi:hypothetical protein